MRRRGALLPPPVEGLAMALLGLLVAGGSLSCRAPSPGDIGTEALPAELPFEVLIDGVEPLISDADVDLVFPSGIDVDADGNLWIADRSLHRVLIVAPEGEVLRTIGRNGGGPGEFRGPRGVGIRGDRAYVLDNAHGVQSFDMQGEYVEEHPSPRVFFDFDFVGDGGVVASNNRVWARGGLVVAIGTDGEERGLIGQPRFEGAADFNFRDVREAILDGTIPEVVRNGSLPIAAPDGTLWVVSHTEGLLQRYGADGALQAETAFELPELAAIEARYYEDFRSLPAGDVFFFPSFVADGVFVNEVLMLLWDNVAGAPGLITVHDRSGALVQRLLLPEIDMGGGGLTVLSLAVDAARRRIYVGVSDIATIFRADVPDGVRGF